MSGGDPRREVAHARLHNQRLAGAPPAGPAEIVAHLGAVQAQEYALTRWSLAMRSGGQRPTEAAIDRALATGQMVRTHVLRDTWHLVAAADARWLLALTGPRVQQRNVRMYRDFGLEPNILDHAAGVIAEALTAQSNLTRAELAAVLETHGIVATGPRLAYVLMNVELEQVVGSGEMRGKQQTYALLDRTVPPSGRFDRDAALAELARRFFASHGPATARDLGWWASLPLRDVARATELAGLSRTRVGDRDYWTADLAPADDEPVPAALLLPPYDEYVVAYRDSRDVVDIAGFTSTRPAGDRTYPNAVLVAGQVIGRWRRQLTGPRLTIEVQMHRRLSRTERQALDAAVADYRDFVGAV